MVYLNDFKLLSSEREYGLLCMMKNVYNSYYPFNLFSSKEFKDIEFEPITIFYGGNGSGKTTLLNIIASKINASKKNVVNKGELFDTYVTGISDFEIINKYDLREIKYIASDDVFDYLLDIRAINNHVNRRKTELAKEYFDFKYGETDSNMMTYEEMKLKLDTRKMTVSKFIRKNLTNNNLVEQSNGESALTFWEREIQDHAIYLLDEPENSLSAENQVKLAKFIEDSARFYDCQFIISTHSPFLLSLQGAKIYDLDSVPVKVRNWTELPNVKVYHEFFAEHKDEF